MADTTHVDIVRNDWFNGEQYLAARATRNGHGIAVQSFDPGSDWDALLRKPLWDDDAHADVDPEHEPDHYLQILHTYWKGSYFFATGLHDDLHCAFPDASTVVRMVPNPVEAE